MLIVLPDTAALYMTRQSLTEKRKFRGSQKVGLDRETAKLR
jgi:hypothetical protein